MTPFMLRGPRARGRLPSRIVRSRNFAEVRLHTELFTGTSGDFWIQL